MGRKLPGEAWGGQKQKMPITENSKLAILKPIHVDTFLGAAKETPKRVPKRTASF